MTKLEILKDILNKGLIKEIFKLEEALFIYNKVSDNATNINDKSFGSFFGSIQRNLLDSIFLSLAKIYEYNTNYEVRSIPNIRKTLEDHSNQIHVQQYSILQRDLKEYFDYDLLSGDDSNDICSELSQFIQDKNPYTQNIAKAIKDSRDKLIAHSEMLIEREQLNRITWEEIDTLINFAKNIVGIISSAFFSSCYIDDNGNCSLTTDAKKAASCLNRLLTKSEIII